MDIFDRFKKDKDFVLAIHIFANVSHFRKLLSEFPWNSQQDWVQWGLLEATLIKARVLTDFLITDSQRHPDDFLAKSMVSKWVQPESDFNKLRGLVNKQVAHFAQQRFIGGLGEAEISTEWLFVELRAVDLAFSKFEVNLR